MEMIENEATKNSLNHETSQARGPSRELNPALFGENGARGRVIDGSISNQLPHLMQTDQKIQDVKEQVSVMADHMGRWSQQHTEFVTTCQQKFERVQQILVKLENNDQYIVSESAQKFSRINDRFAERKSVDSKIQEMIDRHNSVLKSFEMRLSQMQKMLSEREAQLLSTQATLNETKMELARLKRL